MKKIFIIPVILTVTMQPAVSDTPFNREDMHLYLLIGQSNMGGLARIEAQDQSTPEHVYLFNAAGEWETASNPLNRYSSIRRNSDPGLNPGWTFARDIQAGHSGIGIGIISNARGGTSISEWQKGGNYYRAALTRVRDAMETGTLKGILWHQGESDLGDSDGLYLSRLRELVTDLRTDLGITDLPFVAGEVGKWRSAPVNSAINKLPVSLPGTAVVSADDLTHLGDDIHFNSISQRLLGVRYAVAIEALVYDGFVETVATPVIAPPGGSYEGSVQVTISCATADAAIYYTLDGSTPTKNSTKYTGPFTVTSTGTIKTGAFKGGIDSSEIAMAAFTVTVDNEAPEINGVSSDGDSTQVTVLFNELVDPVTVADKANYELTGLTVVSASPGNDGASAVLTVTPMTDGVEYTLTATGIKDRAAIPNTMVSTDIDFMYHSSFVDDFDANRLSWTPQTAARWGLDTDDGDKSYHINTTDYDNAGDKPGEMSLLEGITVSDFELQVDIRSPEPFTNGYADGGVVFGYTDADNFYYFLANTNDDDNQLFKVTNGSRMDLLTMDAPLITDNEYHTLKIRSSDSSVTIWWDGEMKGSVAEVIPDGRVGLCSYNDEVYFDDFRLTPGGTGGTTGLRVPPVYTVPDLTMMENGIYTLTGKKVHGALGTGVYLQVMERAAVKTVKRFVSVE